MTHRPWISFRVNASERLMIERAAKLTRTTLSHFCRKAALSARIGVLTDADRAELGEITGHLTAVCATLNATARAINRRTSRLPDHDAAEEVAGLIVETTHIVDRLEPIFRSALATQGVVSALEDAAFDEIDRQYQGALINFNQIATAFERVSDRMPALSIQADIGAATARIAAVKELIVRLGQP